jgi:hypothetical protein
MLFRALDRVRHALRRRCTTNHGHKRFLEKKRQSEPASQPANERA